ncbi:MAG: alcohol dehydrogenase catalytic domain-containing protein [Halobacteriota archaeon]
MSMPDQMRCLQLTEWRGGLSVSQTAVPDVGVDDVLVEVEAASVGRTVANVVDGNLGDEAANLPRIPGHEFVGRVVETGPAVTNVERGDRVASYTYLVCDHCEACLRGDHSLCENLAGYLSVDIDGGYAEYARLPAGNAIKLPAGIDPLEATVVPDAVATPYHVMNQRANAGPGDDVMVLGAGGGVGVHLVQMAKHFGARVTAVDIVASKLETCRDLGAAHTIDASQHALTDRVAEIGVGYDAIVDLTGSMSLVEEALSALALGGRLVSLTTFPGQSFQVPTRRLVRSELDVVGSRSFSKQELKHAGELVADGTIEPIISEVVDMEGVPELLETITEDELLGRGAMVP